MRRRGRAWSAQFSRLVSRDRQRRRQEDPLWQPQPPASDNLEKWNEIGAECNSGLSLKSTNFGGEW